MGVTHEGVVFIDADDTLWENNVWFTREIDAFVALVAGHGPDRETALLTLHEEEDRHIPVHGYGARPFVHAMRTAFQRLVPCADAHAVGTFERFAADAEKRVREHPIELLAGVADALGELAAAHVRMAVLTKGQPDEQEAKVARSGLARHFEAVRVVPEKDVVAYLAAVAALGARPDACWMVGNSARSDVNPARLAGLRTVHVPHPAPWHRELAEIVPDGPPTLVADSFADVPRLLLGG